MPDTLLTTKQKIENIVAELVGEECALVKEAVARYREAVGAIEQYLRELGVETELRVISGRRLYVEVGFAERRRNYTLSPEEVYELRDYLQKKVEARRAASAKSENENG